MEHGSPEQPGERVVGDTGKIISTYSIVYCWNAIFLTLLSPTIFLLLLASLKYSSADSKCGYLVHTIQGGIAENMSLVLLDKRWPRYSTLPETSETRATWFSVLGQVGWSDPVTSKFTNSNDKQLHHRRDGKGSPFPKVTCVLGLSRAGRTFPGKLLVTRSPVCHQQGCLFLWC